VTGIVLHAGEDWLEIQPHGLGIGLRAFVTRSAAARYATVGAEVSLYTRVQIGDDGPSLFGFENHTEVDVYEGLKGVSGVGPRMAMRILSALPAERLIHALNNGDAKALQSVSGVGARTAARLVVELKGKLVGEETMEAIPDGADEAVEALLALGYSRAEAMDGVSASGTADMTVEEQISAALTALARR
jgi:Holliday junction DNA helicase RuvA